jgi:hypothetical protein
MRADTHRGPEQDELHSRGLIHCCSFSRSPNSEFILRRAAGPYKTLHLDRSMRVKLVRAKRSKSAVTGRDQAQSHTSGRPSKADASQRWADVAEA